MFPCQCWLLVEIMIANRAKINIDRAKINIDTTYAPKVQIRELWNVYKGVS